jgi:hypothetical protein
MKLSNYYVSLNHARFGNAGSRGTRCRATDGLIVQVPIPADYGPFDFLHGSFELGRRRILSV